VTLLKILTVVFIVGGVALLYRAWSTIAGHEITTGTVVELIPGRGSKGGTVYTVVATFQDRMGKKHTYTSSMASNPPENKVGDVIRIMYDREHPDRNTSLAFGHRFVWPWISLGLGLFLLWIVMGLQFGDGIVNSHFPNTH
jgi:hypothetical protein